MNNPQKYAWKLQNYKEEQDALMIANNIRPIKEEDMIFANQGFSLKFFEVEKFINMIDDACLTASMTGPEFGGVCYLRAYIYNMYLSVLLSNNLKNNRITSKQSMHELINELMDYNIFLRAGSESIKVNPTYIDIIKGRIKKHKPTTNILELYSRKFKQI